MKKILIAVLLALNTMSLGTAMAQPVYPTPPYNAQTINNTCGLGGSCGQVLSTLPGYMINPQGTVAAVVTGANINITSGFDINMQGTGQLTNPLPAVITPLTAYPTPASATPLTARYVIVAAGGPTAMFQLLPQLTTLPADVKIFGVINQASNPVALVPYPGDAINLAAAATPFSCATDKLCDCRKMTNGLWRCTP